MVPPIPRTGRNGFFHDSNQFPCGSNRSFFPMAQDCGGDSSGEAFFSVVVKNPTKLLFAVGVDHIVSGQRVAGIHPHIKRRVRLVGESALRSVKLIGRNAEVEKQTVDLFDSEHPTDIRNLPEIASHHRNAIAERRKLFACRADGVLVLIDGNQPSPLAEAGSDSEAVISAARRSVNINAVRADVQRFHAFLKKYGLVGKPNLFFHI